jgi:5-methylthioadenosine/S-adenosylhomocysteine deaminase
MIKKRIGLSIGSDSSASNNKISILEDLKLFSLLQRLDKKNDTFLSDKDLIDMVTINSANALNLSKQIGSIEVGKRADITAFDLSGYKIEPVYNPLSSLIYSGSSDCVDYVWVDGNLKFSKGVFSNNIDTESILEKIRLWQKKIK